MHVLLLCCAHILALLKSLRIRKARATDCWTTDWPVDCGCFAMVCSSTMTFDLLQQPLHTVSGVQGLQM